MTFTLRLLMISTLLAVLTSCSSAPVNTYKPKTPPAQWVEPLPFVQPHDGKLDGLTNWWQQFNDPLLVQLIEAAQKVSPDIESAKARVIAAQTAVTLANSQLLPSVTADMSVSRSKGNMIIPGANNFVYPASTNASIGVNASWELDVWGKNKAAKSAELAKLSGTNALWHDARVIVAAQTATQYLNYRLCEKLSSIAKQNADSTGETARLSDLTAKAGFLAPMSASQSLAQAAEASSQQKKQALQCTLLIKSLVALTAISEPTLKEQLAKDDNSKLPMPAGVEVAAIPATLLDQRPDVLNAERNVDAASFEIAVSDAQRYPRLSLAGNIGLTYDSYLRKFSTNRGRSDGVTWSIGPVAVSLPIFDGGLREANLSAAKAQYEVAKSIYESVARNAVREVEEAMATLNNAALRSDDMDKAASGFKALLDATQMRYKANLASLLELEEARRVSLQAQANTYTLKNEQALAWISLYRAVGGGWAPALNMPALTFDPKLKLAEPNNSVSVVSDQP
ncbi:toluene efflux pump outer membrane protein TtgI precursor [mine drainage metagenome]|uniref:Toluene efflux pump outer membrane protein TtgI n=1 Tax=mine drainage metagenome TaxID=410659 RepID=A0A1J5SS71_9ZZZZ